MTQAQTDALKTVADDKLARSKKAERKLLVKDVAKECTKGRAKTAGLDCAAPWWCPRA